MSKNPRIICTGMCLMVSLVLAMTAAISPQWAWEGSSNNTLGLFLKCSGSSCQSAADVQNHARKAVAAMLILGLISQFASMFCYVGHICSKSEDLRIVMCITSIVTSGFYLIAVAIFGSPKGLQGLSDTWFRGACYVEIIIAFVAVVLASIGAFDGDIEINKRFTSMCCNSTIEAHCATTGLLLAMSLSLGLMGAILPYWASEESEHLGLFLHCIGDTCGGIPDGLQSHSRKAVAAMLLIAIIFQSVSGISFVSYLTDNMENFASILMWLSTVLATIFYLIAVAVFGSPKGLEGLGVTWYRGSSYIKVVLALVTSILLCYTAGVGLLLQDVEKEKLRKQKAKKRKREKAQERNRENLYLERFLAHASGELERELVDQSDEDFMFVSDEFSNGFDGQILQIERVMNRRLWAQFEAECDFVETQLEQTGVLDVPVFQMLFHGSNEESVEQICINGFNRSYCGKNGTLLGDGVYFSTTTKYSNRFAKPNNRGVRKMIFAQVITGNYCKGRRGLKDVPRHVPPYHCVVDNVSNPSICAIFKDASAYPTYIITYRK